MNNKLQLENVKRYHFVIMGYATFPKILKRLEKNLDYYRFEKQPDVLGKEIMYDLENNALSDNGIVLSKQYEEKRIMFKVRKLSYVHDELRRASKKFLLGELDKDAEPKDFSLQISSAIENSFSTPFTIDLDAVVRETMPKIEIEIKSERFLIIGGSGFRGVLLHEYTTYKDVASKKKVSKEGVVLRLPAEEKYKMENELILDVIDRKIKELGLYNMSRFELAQKALYSSNEDVEEFDDEETDEGEN